MLPREDTLDWLLVKHIFIKSLTIFFEVTVVLKDGRSFAGKVIGADSVTDVAVLIVAVAPNSPAARGGLPPGDVITSVKGVQFQNADQV